MAENIGELKVEAKSAQRWPWSGNSASWRSPFSSWTALCAAPGDRINFLTGLPLKTWHTLSPFFALLAALLTGCASGGATTSDCEWMSTILVGKTDVLTDGTARAILKHKERREKICGR
jgi:hypothetical protein